MSLPLSELTGLLRGLKTPSLASNSLSRILEGVELSQGSLAPYLSFRKGGYARHLVHRDDRFELLLLCWDQQARSKVHDHAGQHCFFTPLYGHFAVDDYERCEGGDQPGPGAIRHQRTLVLGPGEVDHRSGGDNEIHRVSVQSPGQAVSLHVYAKPIERCLVFDDESQSWRQRVLRYDRASAPSQTPPERE